MPPTSGGSDVVTFLSDFGRSDIFVGVCHGVVARAAPHARIIDLTHDVIPHDVLQGATLLARAAPHLPVAVHLAVVDPGVGTERRGVAVSVERGDVLIGPDNGLLLPAARLLGGITAAHVLAPAEEPASATFHGRDLFAPAAGAVAGGTTPDQLGPPVDDLEQLDLPGAQIDMEAGEVTAEVVLVDRFGNLQLAVDAGAAGRVGLVAGRGARVTTPGAAEVVRVVRTFGELAPGELGLYPDSDGKLALAVNTGSAAEVLGADRGTRVTVRPAGLAEGPRG